jgi:hypothetical protein
MIEVLPPRIHSAALEAAADEAKSLLAALPDTCVDLREDALRLFEPKQELVTLRSEVASADGAKWVALFLEPTERFKLLLDALRTQKRELLPVEY